MIKKVLIANRGEIAVRIIRACREMGIETVAVYSEADRDALHTQLADEAVCIGPAPSSESYLSMENIISATIVTGADAIHPGFGFLSENSRFAELCEQCNITFIGPPSTVIASLGNKQAAKNTMKRSVIRSSSKLLLVEAARECELLIHRQILKKVSVPHRKKRRWLLAILRCTWSILYVIQDILNFRSWQINSVM